MKLVVFRKNENIVFVVSWCSEQVTDIYEVKTFDDFQTCSNIPNEPVAFPAYDNGGVEGFIVGVETGERRYFVSKSLCKEGMKVQIERIPPILK